MKYFITDITTQYDGYEWGQRWIVKAKNKEKALEKAKKQDFTHDNGIEIQEIDNIWEITKEQAETILKTRALFSL